jgi:TetR/AcrR family tetracycline transcriptional repressor
MDNSGTAARERRSRPVDLAQEVVATRAPRTGGPFGMRAGLAARPRLTRERIVAGAIGFVGRHCLADLSMRRLGTELGVEAMSLYRYFPSKAALFDALVDVALDEVARQVGDQADWESAVRAYARSFRRVALAQPRLFPLLACADVGHRGVRLLVERMSEMWRRAGFDEATARYAQCAVHAFTMGTVSGEVGVSFGPPGYGHDRADGTGSRGAADGRSAGRVADAEFEFSLDVLIEGLRERMAARRPERVYG